MKLLVWHSGHKFANKKKIQIYQMSHCDLILNWNAVLILEWFMHCKVFTYVFKPKMEKGA